MLVSNLFAELIKQMEGGRITEAHIKALLDNPRQFVRRESWKEELIGLLPSLVEVHGLKLVGKKLAYIESGEKHDVLKHGNSEVRAYDARVKAFDFSASGLVAAYQPLEFGSAMSVEWRAECLTNCYDVKQLLVANNVPLFTAVFPTEVELYHGKEKIDSGRDIEFLSFHDGLPLYLLTTVDGKRVVKWGSNILGTVDPAMTRCEPVSVIRGKLFCIFSYKIGEIEALDCGFPFEYIHEVLDEKALLVPFHRDIKHADMDDDMPLYVAQDETGWTVWWGDERESVAFADICALIRTGGAPAYVARPSDDDRWAAYCGDVKSKDYDEVFSLTCADRVISFGARRGRRLFHVSYQMP